MPTDRDVRRNLPATFALVLETQYQHGQAVKGETPNHAEGIGFAQQVDIAMACQDGEQLQEHNQIHDPISCAKARMRMTEPVSENAVFRDPVERAVRADDRCVNRAGKNQEPDHDYEAAEDELQQLRAPKMH